MAKYFSMFSGVGGFELGIQRAFDTEHAPVGEKSKPKERPQGRKRTTDSTVQLRPGNEPAPLCVGYSEIDKYAIATYEKHFKEHTNYGDATTIDTDRLPDFDLLVGGFPCQAFSIAGKRAGFNDTRGTLFFEVARILKDKRPRHFILENVKGLLSHDEGKTFRTILGVLADLGYRVEWQVLNAKYHGVPQNRERVFIIGHLGGECGRQVFPIAKPHQEDVSAGQKEPSGRSWVSTLDSRYGERWSTETYVRADKPDTPRGGAESDHTNAIRRTPYTDGARIRRLTPKECERLQGFPDDWTSGVSDTQRYKQMGNAVTVNVIEAIAEKLINKDTHAG